MKIVWRTSDGAVLISSPAVRLDGETDSEQLQRTAEEILQKGVVPAGSTWHAAQDADIPADRTFRKAWSSDGTKLQVDMAKARAVHMDRIREVRDKKLTALDVETIRALGKDNTARRDEVEAEKDTLRDLPQTFDLTIANTPEELNKLWPSELGQREVRRDPPRR